MRRRAFLMAVWVAYGATAAIVNAPSAAWAAERPLTLLALGDSLTAGYGVEAAQSFPARLEHALRASGRDVRVINAGVSGDTSAGGLARLDWSLGDHPDAVLVELGANDALRGLDPAQTRANLDAIVGRLRGAGLPVLLAGMEAPPNLGAAYGQAFRAIFPAVAQAHGARLYPFFLDGVAANPSLNQKDGMHPNPAGVEVIVGRILPSVRQLLDQVRP